MSQWNKYEADGGARAGRPGREVRPKSITIDVHSHVGVPRASRIREAASAAASPPRWCGSPTPRPRRSIRSRRPTLCARASLEQRLADLDAMGLDMQVIKPPPPQCYYAVPIEIAVEAAQIVNDGIAEFVARKPDRLRGFGTVPMPDGNEAAKELERCVTKLGFKGVQVLTNVNGKELSDPAFAPFWKKAEELGALVVIHPNGFTDAGRLSRFYFNNVIGNPLETTHRRALSDLRRRAGAPPEAEDFGRSRRRLSGEPMPGASIMPGARARTSHGNLPHPPTTLPEEPLLRHGRVHPTPAAGARAPLRRRPHPHGHRLSLRHGRLRSRGARLRPATSMRQRRRPSAAAMPRRCWGCSGRGTKRIGARQLARPVRRLVPGCEGLFPQQARANHRIGTAMETSEAPARQRCDAAQCPLGPFATALRDQRRRKHISVRRKCHCASFVVHAGYP